jgi:hypothetical protein
MPIQVTRLTESDVQGAITSIQLAFADDPYNHWVYDERSKVNRHSAVFHTRVSSFTSLFGLCVEVLLHSLLRVSLLSFILLRD